MRYSTLGIALAWIMATGCTGDGAAERAVPDIAPDDTADGLVELPPAPDVGRAPADMLALGEWDWSAPCRVPVSELIGGVGPQASRTFVVTVEDHPTGEGLLIAFEDVEVELRGLGDEFWAAELFRYLAVLPAMRLDSNARFIEFVDLEDELVDLAASAGLALPAVELAALAANPVVAETILDRTIRSWYVFWMDHPMLPFNPDRVETVIERPGPDEPALVSRELFAAPAESGDVWGPVPEGAVWLTYAERPAGSITRRVDVDAIVDPSSRRPSYVSLAVNGFDVGDARDVGETGDAADTFEFADRDRRIVRFDWANAEGCT